MEEENRTQEIESVDDEGFVTAAGADITMSVEGSVTGNEAEHENPVTSVTVNEAEPENPVTSVTNEKPDTKVIRVTVPDLERIMLSGHKGEKPATVLHRLLGEMDALQTEVVEFRRNATHSPSTEIVPGQQPFSIKDAMESLRDVCDDDELRLKFAAKLLEEQARSTNSRLAREHDAEQKRLDREDKRLDREDKDKDRDLKEKLTAMKGTHDKEITMIKKGMINEDDLENIVFLGQKGTSPADRIKNKMELAARVAAHEEEEFGDVDPPGGDPGL